MTVLETKGIATPEAPVVWAAVAYAREMAPLRLDFGSPKAKAEKAEAEQDHAQQNSHQRHWKRHQFDHVTHEDAVEALVGEWLTVRGSDDLSTILTYMSQMDVAAPDQLWVSDLTYIRLGHEFVYLAVVLDACSRRCLGWALGRRLDAALATTALRMALKERKPQVHHSDRGVQYASGEYTSLLKARGVTISMPPIKP